MIGKNERGLFHLRQRTMCGVYSYSVCVIKRLLVEKRMCLQGCFEGNVNKKTHTTTPTTSTRSSTEQVLLIIDVVEDSDC